MQARSLLDSVKWHQKLPAKTYSTAKTLHSTHEVSDGIGAWLQFFLAPKKCPPWLIMRQNQGFSRDFSKPLPKFASCVKPSITEFTHTKNHCIPRSTWMSMKIAHPRLKTISPWPSLTTTWKKKQKAFQIANRGGENPSMHQISERTEAAQMQSSESGIGAPNGARLEFWWMPLPPFQEGDFFFAFFWKLVSTFSRSSKPLITAFTRTKNHSSPRSRSLSMIIHSESMTPPPFLQIRYLNKTAEGLPDRESRKSKSNHAWNFKEKWSCTNKKLCIWILRSLQKDTEACRLIHAQSHVQNNVMKRTSSKEPKKRIVDFFLILHIHTHYIHLGGWFIHKRWLLVINVCNKWNWHLQKLLKKKQQLDMKPP